MQLAHKLVLVTGATGGIGSHVCSLLDRKGATLVLNGCNPEALGALRARLDARHHVVAADIATPGGRDAIVAACNAAGGVDALINLAGILDFDMFSKQSELLIERMLQVNTTGPVLLCRALLPQLLARPVARILNVGSIFGSIGHPGFVAYCASKAALKAFSEALAREMADTTVSVAYIAPRATATLMNTDRVMALNAALGNACDKPADVAAEIVAMLEGTGLTRYLGWPEKLFVRLNALLPALVHSALVKKLSLIRHHSGN